MTNNHCPRCGQRLEKRRLENTDRGYCPSCQLPVYENPVPAMAVASGLPAVDLQLPWGAYVITSQDHLQIAEQACSGGARVIQYRDKTAPPPRRLEIARAIRRVTRQHGALFIVNDHIDTALLSAADGVHLGQDDLGITEARKIVPAGFLIGRSTHSLDQAVEAQGQGAHYIGIGPVFATPTKENYPPIGLETLCQVAAAITIPFVAIGGITLQNLAGISRAGAVNVAMVREFQKETAQTVRAVNKVLRAATEREAD
ncbi:MAG: thiamine phosphate synthase [Acidobacteria bacterium]|nr:thiamine phosphate synthase [Acidobacteriota bacterium]MBU4307803.1 thiamine phosphate synthase [Acidobacteriota bacterium]MBU4404608.1 thiamine phosphate synthase [Acidobacteriota bacterium]MCG2810940.1 thiamine phosphate synthase [Candidatus Aminicenantes bacterium]